MPREVAGRIKAVHRQRVQRVSAFGLWAGCSTSITDGFDVHGVIVNGCLDSIQTSVMAEQIADHRSGVFGEH